MTRRPRSNGVILVGILTVLLLGACQFGSGVVEGGTIAMSCTTPDGVAHPPSWAWAPKPGAAAVTVAVVNSEVSAPIAAVYEAPPLTTSGASALMLVRVWDGHASTGYQVLPPVGPFRMALQTTDGSSPPGRTSWVVAAVDGQGRDVGFDCLMPSPA